MSLPANKLSILCVDDERIVLDTLFRQLQNHFGKSFEYEMAESVDEAWDVIEDLSTNGSKLQLVISDWLMPGTKGDEFLVELHQKYPQAIKILLTGQADDDAISNAKNNANLAAYMAKPWNTEALLSTIQGALMQTNA